MFNGEAAIEGRFDQALKVVLTGLDGREEMTKDEIDGLRRELQALYEGDIRALEGTLEVDLSHWLEG